MSSVREIIGTANRIVASAEVAAVPVTIGFIRAAARAGRKAKPRAPRRCARATDPFFLDPEKIVWQWPDDADALIEEVR